MALRGHGVWNTIVIHDGVVGKFCSFKFVQCCLLFCAWVSFLCSVFPHILDDGHGNDKIHTARCDALPCLSV